MDTKTKRGILKNYLGRFYVPVDPPEIECYSSLLSESECCYLLAPLSKQLKFGCVQLMRGKRLNWAYTSTYDLISRFLDSELDEPFYSFNYPVVIIQHLKAFMSNKRLEELTSHTITHLWLEGKRVLFLTEENLPSIRALYVDAEKKILSLNSAISNSTIEEI